jgi:hypothetical protein
MSLNETIVEDAALTWFGELGYAVGHGPHLAPGEPAASSACALHADKRDPFCEAVLLRRLRKAIRWIYSGTSCRPIAVPGATFPNLLFGKCHPAVPNY